MTCPRCHAENRDGLRFCEDCGSRLTLTCAQCGGELAPGKRFCGSCGAPAPGESAARPPSPESYTPKHLAERILTSKSALEGERKQVTVLFADLKGSMELLADRDPEEARKLLDPVLEHMMEAVHRYEGTVNQVMGDGIMALFGAPLAHEDHAVRACYAALRMQESVRRYAEGVRRVEGIPIQIRVGLNSGEVVVRAIGSDLHMDYTAIGHTTHLAARMEQLASPASILMTPETLALAEGFVQVAALGPMAVRGVPAPVEVYELTGVSAVRSRLQATATRGLTRFVGRDAEMEQLHRALEQARRGRGQVAALVGEPGVGKSRVVFELTRSHRFEGWLVLEAGSVSYGKATSYLPALDLLKSYFRIGDRDAYRDIREKVTGKLLTLDRGLEPALPALLGLLDVPIEDPEWVALDPRQRRQRTLDDIKRLLLRETEAQPVLLVFEDLHWIDAETQTLLDSLVESLPAARILLLVSYRPEYGHAWGQKMYYSQLRLDPLLPDSLDELLDARLGRDLSLQPLKSFLAKNTGGNPLFLEESIRTLVEQHALLGEQGAYRLAKPIATVQVPPTVQAILAARIDRLPPEEKQLLETAAVIGRDFTLTLLQAITGEPDQALRPRLDHLQATEFVYSTRLFPDLEFTFKHALTHEVAYGTLLQERRRILHSRIFQVIERLHPDRIAEHVDQLAYHALRAELWEQAVPYLRQAGLKALTRSALHEAAQCFERALEALEHLPQSRPTVEHAIDLRFDLRTALLAQGEYTRITEHLKTAETLAKAIADRPRLGRISVYMCTHFSSFAEHDLALAAGEQAAACGDFGTETVAMVYLGFTHHSLGDYRRAIDLFNAGAEALGTHAIGERFGQFIAPSVVARSYAAHSLVEVGRFDQAIQAGTQAVDIADRLDHLPSRMIAFWGLGAAWLHIGRHAEAVSELERGMAICRNLGLVTYLHFLAPAMGAAYVASGRAADAIMLLEEVASQPAIRMLMCYRAPALEVLGEAYLLAGDARRAEQTAEYGRDLAREKRQRGYEARIDRVLAEIAWRTDLFHAEKVAAHYQTSLSAAAELGMRPLVAHCHLGLGKLYRRTGDAAKAEEHLTTARAMYREMGMGFWLEKAAAAVGGDP